MAWKEGSMMEGRLQFVARRDFTLDIIADRRGRHRFNSVVAQIDHVVRSLQIVMSELGGAQSNAGSSDREGNPITVKS